MIWIIYVFLGIGIVFQALGTFALHRFPDVYTRIHGATNCSTFGSIFLYVGVILHGILFSDCISFPVHTFLVMVLLLVTNPVGAHAIARAAYKKGILPKGAEVDKLQEAGKCCLK